MAVMAAKKRKKTSLTRVFHVSAEDIGKPLCGFLAGKLPELPAQTVRKSASARHIQLNGNLCLDGNRLLRKGDVVKYFAYPLAPAAHADDINILYRDRHLVVVDKPSGLTSVREPTRSRSRPETRGRRQATLEDLLPAVLDRDTPRIRTAKTGLASGVSRGGKAQGRPGTTVVFPVHRLDRDTSGLMLFALTKEAADRLVDMFLHHKVSRTYRAVAMGEIRSPGMTIDTFFDRDRGDGLRGSVATPSPGSQRAITHVRPVARLGSFTLAECRLETGRTHQIRIHLAESGHMICGEKMYVRQPGGKRILDESGAPRLALHAFRLEFRHPITGKPIVVESPLPRDLSAFVNRLQASSRK